MKYSLKEHGDFLERNATDFVMQYLPFYESVWSLYVGHNGKGVMPDMHGYPVPEKRINFAENSYTVLQSAVIIKDILDSGIFTEPHVDFKTILEFHKSLVAFYALIGRIRDCLKKAVKDMGLSDIEPELKEFYDERNIMLHGRTIPLNTDEMGLAKIPYLKLWDDKASNWADVKDYDKEFVVDNNEKTFLSLTKLINSIYGRVYDILCKELKSLGLALEVNNFEYLEFATSGTTRVYAQPIIMNAQNIE
ncbi:MAG TPA: hypothetical protein VK588_16090 [Chitinophagaceae bacterium]|nr:hypothetical protein [Chitinophagaceae bacterium]